MSEVVWSSALHDVIKSFKNPNNKVSHLIMNTLRPQEKIAVAGVMKGEPHSQRADAENVWL